LCKSKLSEHTGAVIYVHVDYKTGKITG